ncbi:MAG: hypothetical protein CL908_14155 [Deltaproteobacteria bacterium]|nr:hypothetical protein [Deltaproteobacteria bacterium]
METTEDFDGFHERALPKRLEGDWGAVAARGSSGLPPLAFRLPDGRAYTYVPGKSGVEVVAGDGGAKTVVELDEALWRGLLSSMETPSGLILFQKAKVLSGEVSDFVNWEPALRVLYEGLPPYDPQAPLVGSDGREIDPSTSFHADDDPERMADFLRTAGYILVREVLPSNEVEDLLEAAEALRASARQGEPTSWWGKHQDGRTILTRVINGGSDPRIRSLLRDPRLLKIVRLSDVDLEATDTDVIHVLFKQSGMVFDGKSDNPWHRDCGLGLHKVMCPIMNGSLFLRSANRDAGELRFLPGSWQTAGCSVADQDSEIGVGIEANPGDFALHYGDGMHAGPPPRAKDGPFRSSVVFEFGPPGRRPEEGQEYYDMQMHDIDAGQLR